MEIRPFKESDTLAVWKLEMLDGDPLYGFNQKMKLKEFREWAKKVLKQGSIILVLEDKGKIAGEVIFNRWTTFKERERNHIMGVGITVKKGCRRKGWGKKLIEEGIKRARKKKGIKKIVYQCSEYNKRSKALAESLGFEVEARLKRHERIGKNYYDYYHYAKFI